MYDDKKVKEEARALATRVGTHPDWWELRDHYGTLEQYPALVRYIHHDYNGPIAGMSDERFTRKVADYCLNGLGGPDLPATVFRYAHRLDLRVTTDSGEPAIERRWANDIETLTGGGFHERRLLTGFEYRIAAEIGGIGKIFNAGWAWKDKETYPKDDRPLDETKKDILQLAVRIAEKIKADNFSGLSGDVEELERVIWQGLGKHYAAEWKKERESEAAAAAAVKA